MTPDQLISCLEDAEAQLRDLKEGARYGEDLSKLLERLNAVSNVLSWIASSDAPEAQPDEECDGRERLPTD